jgi:hypothetical protein
LPKRLPPPKSFENGRHDYRTFRRGLIRANEERKYNQILTQIVFWHMFTFERFSHTRRALAMSSQTRRTHMMKTALAVYGQDTAILASWTKMQRSSRTSTSPNKPSKPTLLLAASTDLTPPAWCIRRKTNRPEPVNNHSSCSSLNLLIDLSRQPNAGPYAMRFSTISTGTAAPSNSRVPGSGVDVGGGSPPPGPTGTPPTDKPSIARPESNAVSIQFTVPKLT